MMQKSGKWMGAAFGAALAVAAITLLVHGVDNKAIRLALELTARFSFVLFLLAYAGGALATLFRLDGLAGRGREFGLAFAAAQLCSAGVYVVANGTVFPGDRVRKNRELNCFELIPG